MTIEIKLPQWAMTLSEGTILEWKKDVGDPVSQGDALCEVETAKATDFVYCNADGILLKRLVEEGETIPVLTAICLIGESDEVL